jgi:ribosomal protein S12 methylthiotransferase accessory factor
MSVDTTALTPLEHSRIRVERYLRERLSDGLSPGGVRIEGVVPHVDVLGLRDALREAPDPADPGRVVIPVYLHGHTALLGPATSVEDPQPPCFHCVAMRWQKLRPEQHRNVLELGGRVVAAGGMPHLTDFALDAIWRTFAQLAEASADPPRTSPHGFPYVYELRLDTLRIRRYPIISDPACVRCARPRPDTAQGAVVEFTSRRKRAVDDFRISRVGDYRLPIHAFANPVCGMLGTTAIPNLASSTTSTVTGYLFVRGGRNLFDFFWSGHADSYDDSAVLAVCEGLERYAGLQRCGVDDLVVDSYANLGGQALDPRECGVYSDEFYRTAPSFFTEFTADLVLPWVWGYSLRDSRPILVPERLVYYLGRENSAHFVEECSNGCAAGSCLEEATFYAMLELIERDAFLLGWYGKVPLPEIDPTTCRSVAIKQMIDRVGMAGYDVRLFDNRIDLPIPVVTAVATRRDGGIGTMCLASGASFDPEDAIRAALCEIATYATDFDQRTLKQLDEVRSMVDDYTKVTDLHHHPLLFGLPEMAPHTEFLLGESRAQPIGDIYRDWEAGRPRTLDLLDDLTFCRDRLVEAGFDVIVVDQTPPEQRAVGMRTACVIVPGMIPIDFGWTKQRALHMPRMFSAFRRAGWRDTDLDPSELHLVPHPFP